MAIKFLRDAATKEGTPQTFKKDQVVDFYALYRADPELKAQHGDQIDKVASEMAQASERHWINRGAAEQVKDERKAKADAKAESLVPGPAAKGHGKTEAL